MEPQRSDADATGSGASGGVNSSFHVEGRVAAPTLSPPRKKTRGVSFSQNGGDETNEDDDDDVQVLQGPQDDQDVELLHETGPRPLALPTQPSAAVPVQGMTGHTPEQLMQMIPEFMEKMGSKIMNMETTLVQKLDQMQVSQRTVLETVDAHTAQIASIDARIQAIENHQQNSNHEVPTEVAQLQHQVQDLSVKMQELSQSRAQSAPPLRHRAAGIPSTFRASSVSPGRQRPGESLLAPASVLNDMDWNRLVLGGWHVDTRRETVEAEAKALLPALGLEAECRDLIVYGRRASTCHVLPHPLPEADAKRRLLKLKMDNQDKHVLRSSGKHAWLTQHKSAQKRLNNRATRYALELVKQLVGLSDSERLDVDWNKQILWLDDLRVAAFHATDLLAPDTAAIKALTYQDPRGDATLTFHINMTRLSSAAHKSIPALEEALSNSHAE
eukprot:Skav230653  [mRNA]  locus=scaffold2103:257131:258459:- [translate_table: standard]